MYTRTFGIQYEYDMQLLKLNAQLRKTAEGGALDNENLTSTVPTHRVNNLILIQICIQIRYTSTESGTGRGPT